MSFEWGSGRWLKCGFLKQGEVGRQEMRWLMNGKTFWQIGKTDNPSPLAQCKSVLIMGSVKFLGENNSLWGTEQVHRQTLIFKYGKSCGFKSRWGSIHGCVYFGPQHLHWSISCMFQVLKIYGFITSYRASVVKTTSPTLGLKRGWSWITYPMLIP